MTRYQLANLIRQTRHRARRRGLVADLGIDEAWAILNTAECCDLCDGDDELGQVLAIPLKLGGPVVPANLVICCPTCAAALKQSDLLAMNSQGLVGPDRLASLVKRLRTRRSWELVRTLMRKLLGQ